MIPVNDLSLGARSVNPGYDSRLRSVIPGYDLSFGGMSCDSRVRFQGTICHLDHRRVLSDIAGYDLSLQGRICHSRV